MENFDFERNQLVIEDINFQTLPAGASSVIWPAAIGLIAFAIMFS